MATVNLTAKNQDAASQITLLGTSKFSDSAGKLYSLCNDQTQAVAIANPDITGDGNVGINDLVKVAKLFGVTKTDASYLSLWTWIRMEILTLQILSMSPRYF